MKVEGQAISLGVDERSGVKDGKEYSYCRLNYIIKGENEVMQYYLPDLNDIAKKQLLYKVATWGIYFNFEGELTGKKIELNRIDPVFE